MGKTILVVEDNVVNQKLLALLLKSCGYECAFAADGMTGVKMAATNDFAAVLMDIEMPDMDGLTATCIIRDWELKQPTRRRVPIIAVTAHAVPGCRERYLAAGMDDFVAKPVTRQNMVALLQKWAP